MGGALNKIRMYYICFYVLVCVVGRVFVYVCVGEEYIHMNG